LTSSSSSSERRTDLAPANPCELDAPDDGASGDETSRFTGSEARVAEARDVLVARIHGLETASADTEPKQALRFTVLG
jgi:hypothetical protein